jgi:hypothetical protein
MKVFLFLLVFIFSKMSLAQEVIYVKSDDSCEAGIIQAKEDIEKGYYELLSYGLIMRTNQEFQDFYVQYVQDTYQVKLGDGGCVVSDKILCYSDTMEKAILEKFGKDFFARTTKEAHQKYEELKLP